MKKSCKYCNRIHERTYECPSKPVRQKKPTYIDKFRWSKQWQHKRVIIKDRDQHLCQLCVRDNRLSYTNIEVHHIVPIAEDWDKRLDENYLICLCKQHHEKAEANDISREELLSIVKEQEARLGT